MRMNELINLTIDIPQQRGLTLILTQDKAHQNKTDLIANLILNGPLLIVLGDRWFPSLVLPRIIRTHTIDIKAVLSRLYIVRVSTCYRLFYSLANIPSKGEPILILDFLHTFYDNNIPLRTRFFKLRGCCRELKRLAFYRQVIVITQEMEGENYEKFIPALYTIANKTFTLGTKCEQFKQAVLF